MPFSSPLCHNNLLTKYSTFGAHLEEPEVLRKVISATILWFTVGL